MLKCLSNRIVIRQYRRCFSISFCRQTQEILSDERLKELVAELQKPLNPEDNSTVVLATMESLRPRQKVITTNEYQKLYTLLNKSYNKHQLAEYLASKQMYKKNSTKRSMLTTILQNTWGIKTREQVREERKKRIIEQFPASRQELFFIIGDNGSTIRKIEEANKVNVTIDVTQSRYLIEGQPSAVENAKQDIQGHLKLVEGQVQVPIETLEDSRFRSEISRVLAGISKVSGSYISLDNDKFVFTSLSDHAMENAKRLLNLTLTELNMTSKKPLEQANKTLVDQGSEFNLVPFHDSLAMPMYDRQFGWSRLKKKNDSENKEPNLINLADQQTMQMSDIKELLLSAFKQEEYKDISLEAKFGHLLCRNSIKAQMTPNLLQPISTSDINISSLQELIKSNQTTFFNAMPPAKLASDFIPSISEGGVHQKLIKAEYVNNELLMDVDNNDQPKDNDMLNRLQVEFIVQENGSMKFNRAIGEKKRSVIDVLGLTSDIDVRFIARQFIDYSAEDLRQLFEKFKLLSYSEMVAPLHYKDMTLLDVSHINKKRYLYADDNLIYINRVQEQDKRTRRTEVELVSVDPVTLDTRNAVERWSSFLNNVSNLVYKWKL